MNWDHHHNPDIIIPLHCWLCTHPFFLRRVLCIQNFKRQGKHTMQKRWKLVYLCKILDRTNKPVNKYKNTFCKMCFFRDSKGVRMTLFSCTTTTIQAFPWFAYPSSIQNRKEKISKSEIWGEKSIPTSFFVSSFPLTKTQKVDPPRIYLLGTQ